jgi:RNA recognition motif-containing protein
MKQLQANSVHSFNVTPEELFDLFGKFGPVRYVSPPAMALAPAALFYHF